MIGREETYRCRTGTASTTKAATTTETTTATEAAASPKTTAPAKAATTATEPSRAAVGASLRRLGRLRLAGRLNRDLAVENFLSRKLLDGLLCFVRSGQVHECVTNRTAGTGIYWNGDILTVGRGA